MVANGPSSRADAERPPVPTPRLGTGSPILHRWDGWDNPIWFSYDCSQWEREIKGFFKMEKKPLESEPCVLFKAVGARPSR